MFLFTLPSKDSGQAIPRVVESCIRYINLYGESVIIVQWAGHYVTSVKQAWIVVHCIYMRCDEWTKVLHFSVRLDFRALFVWGVYISLFLMLGFEFVPLKSQSWENAHSILFTAVQPFPPNFADVMYRETDTHLTPALMMTENMGLKPDQSVTLKES